jgi:hypothetical protein
MVAPASRGGHGDDGETIFNSSCQENRKYPLIIYSFPQPGDGEGIVIVTTSPLLSRDWRHNVVNLGDP